MPKKYNLFLKGWVGGWNFSTDMVSYILDKNPSGSEVLISSLGGYTHEGLTIASLFRLHGKVHCHLVGQCASAATIAAMGAARITMDSSAVIMIHRCRSFVEGSYMNADELDKFIEKCRKEQADNDTIDRAVASLYAARCGRKSADEILKVMQQERWISAERALELGLIDEITDCPDDKESSRTSAFVAAALAENGLPLPPQMAPEKSRLDRFFSSISSLFKSDAPDDGADAPDAADDALGKENADLRTKISALEAKIAAMSAEPDADTTSVVEPSKKKESAYLEPSGDPQADARAILKHLI